VIGVMCGTEAEGPGRGEEGNLGVRLGVLLGVRSTSMAPPSLGLGFTAEPSLRGELERQGEEEAVLRSTCRTEGSTERPLGKSSAVRSRWKLSTFLCSRCGLG
jgi:hypothetical protein